MITSSTRVSDALAERPELRDVLSAFHPAFARLHHPVLGRVLPKLVTVGDAARIAGVDVDALVAVMNCPVDAPNLPKAPVREAEAAPAWFDPSRVTLLDVRPTLAGGEDPLSQILRALRALPEGGQLTVVAPFEPVPLIGLLGRQGWAAWTRQEGDWYVTFGRAGTAENGEGVPPVSAVASADGWSLDVRTLPPPEPMRAILAAVDAGQLPLHVLHAREPALLWPHLTKRGLSWAVASAPEGVLIDVRRG